MLTASWLVTSHISVYRENIVHVSTYGAHDACSKSDVRPLSCMQLPDIKAALKARGVAIPPAGVGDAEARRVQLEALLNSIIAKEKQESEEAALLAERSSRETPASRQPLLAQVIDWLLDLD